MKMIIIVINIDFFPVAPFLKYAIMHSYSQNVKTKTNIQNTICTI